MGPLRLLGLILLVTGIIAAVVTFFRSEHRIRELIPSPWLQVVVAGLLVFGLLLLIIGG